MEVGNSNRTVEISDGSGKKLLMEFYLIIYLFIVGFNKMGSGGGGEKTP
jgi:hypothetical protein